MGFQHTFSCALAFWSPGVVILLCHQAGKPVFVEETFSVKKKKLCTSTLTIAADTTMLPNSFPVRSIAVCWWQRMLLCSISDLTFLCVCHQQRQTTDESISGYRKSITGRPVHKLHLQTRQWQSAVYKCHHLPHPERCSWFAHHR